MLSPDNAPILGVGGVLYRWSPAGRLELLLIKKRGGFWTLPKGQLKPGEDDHTALSREIYEETGLRGAIEAQVEQVSYQIYKRGHPRTKIVTYYCVRARAGKLRPGSSEGIEHARWFAIDAVFEQIQRPRIRGVVRRAWAILDERAGGDAGP